MRSTEFLAEDRPPFERTDGPLGWEDAERWERLRPLRVTLEARGYRYLISGSQQTVYLPPSGRGVIKTFEGDRFDPIDAIREGAGPPPLNRAQRVIEVYGRYIGGHQGNPHLPREFRWGSFWWRSDRDRRAAATYLWVTMEDLEEGALRPPYREALRRVSAGLLEPEHRGASMNGDPDLGLWWDTLADLYKIGRSRDWIWDAVKDENIMFRGGVPVIVDPWSA